MRATRTGTTTRTATRTAPADAAALHARALALVNRGRPAAARPLLDRAATAATTAGDGDLLARVLGTRAYVEAETGDAPAAVALCERALAVPGVDGQVRATIAGQLGLVELRRGDARRALTHLDRALPGLHEPALRARVLLNRGNAHLELGHGAAAERDYAAAHDAYLAAGRRTDAALARHNQGYAAGRAGDLALALDLMAGARDDAVAGSPVATAVSDADRAEVLLAAGMPAEAAPLLARAAAVHGAHGLRRPQAEAEVLLARTLLTSDPARSAVVARRAARRLRAHGAPVPALRAEVVAAAAATAAGRPPAAADLDDLEARARAAGLPDEATLVAHLAARAVLAREGAAAACARLRRGRLPARAGATVSTTTLVAALEVRATVALAAGRRAEALAAARRGTDLLRRWEARLGSPDLQGGVAGHGRGLALVGTAAALAGGRAETVLAWSERARGLASVAVGPRAPGTDPPTPLAAAGDTLGAPVTDPARHPAPDPAAEAELTELRALGADATGPDRARAEALQRRLRERRWVAAAGPEESRGDGGGGDGDDEGGGDRDGPVPPVRLAALQAALAATATTALVWVRTADGLHALVVGPASARLVALDATGLGPDLFAGLRADLDVVAARLPAALRAPARAALDERLALLAARVVAPALAAVPTSRVVLSVPGMLAGVPWTLVPGLDDRAVTVAPSLTRWVRQVGGPRPAAHPPGPASALLVAGPDVPRAEEEVRAVAAVRAATGLASTLLVGPDATTAAVAGPAARADLLHLVGHGRHAPENPWFSAVRLADGPWWGYDVGRLAAVPTTVVLSACELGQASGPWGDESLGMARAWLHAGARCVLASPAAVADDEACVLLPAVHAGLAAGRSPAEALADATASTGARTPVQAYGAGW
ncbi:CHAT domain-containing protein [Cellulomonas marina]|uniref:CHAT domain-containing protein n=1 Tax=Cellulomonas marina TaxID=988821 RepID=A0A1I0WSR2_9CELL|nr:CHAT domain-containing protein [Cellulomonas marina]GIG27814.1 hypothetical protein Cma02nite_04140 [Cellulomonas marina]SFA90993.1 CHAT domain-containing protein [Cellulomonas marina]